jgi:CheY-like chemotaxis protein
MDEATQRQMFEPFFTTKEHGKGTGLGLSIVYGIVSQSGGWIAVDSAEDRGTTFRIHFPRVERPAVAAEAAPDSPVPGGTETILLVEDETEVRRFAALSLRNLGYQVIEASSGEEALRLYQDHTEPINLLLTDVVMPGMTGVELAKQLQSLDSGVKVIFASGYADSTILRHGVLDAGVSLLQKPYTPSVLAGEVRKALDPPNQAVAIA